MILKVCRDAVTRPRRAVPFGFSSQLSVPCTRPPTACSRAALRNQFTVVGVLIMKKAKTSRSLAARMGLALLFGCVAGLFLCGCVKR